MFVTGNSGDSIGWVRRISPSGQVRTLDNNFAWFPSRFADGNVYYGENCYSIAIHRYLVASSDTHGS